MTDTIVSIAFSGHFYRDFNLGDDLTPNDRMFRRGLTKSENYLPYTIRGGNPKFHFVLSVATDKWRNCDKVNRLLNGHNNFFDDSQAATNSVGFSPNHKKSNPLPKPFGYRDGLTEDRGIEENAAVTLVEETRKTTPKSKGRTRTFPAGTFMYYQNIQLNPDKFKKLINQIVVEIIDNDAEDKTKETKRAKSLAKALIMGRFPEGVPIIAADNDCHASELAKMPFGYTYDSAASICPFQAHIRKANPRPEGSDPRTTRNAPIVRRSNYYGKLNLDNKNPPEVQGIHFVSFQNSIDVNLRSIMLRMKEPGSFDPITYGDDSPSFNFKIPNRYLSEKKDEGHDVTVNISKTDQLVTYKNGEFFYVPSKFALCAYIKNLKAQKDEG
ncbi:hypothetical protein [Lewinella sp. 4G2]|uniref:hypothetical protein n=1 Tax=Lewinella sp. 4G2 TaxID=1803372 RepID=UPI0012F76129|nr:hypothetical protein [Lewinella sp. 4G2]